LVLLNLASEAVLQNPRTCRYFAIKSLRYGRGEVGLVDNVVAIKHAPRLPPAEPHDLTLRHPGTTEVPCGAPTEIVEESSCETRPLARASAATCMT
jgi:hypothetical protein